MTLHPVDTENTQLVDADATESRALFPTRPPLQSAVDVLLGVHDVCALTGLSYKQLDFGLRTGYYQCEGDARGSGTVRAFTLPQLRRVILIAWLTKGGLTPAHAAALIDGDSTLLLAAFPGGPT